MQEEKFRKIQNNTKLLEDKLEKNHNETSKSSKVQVMEKSNTYRSSSDHRSRRRPNWRKPYKKQENATNTIKENDVIKTPYRHPNNKNRYPKS